MLSRLLPSFLLAVFLCVLRSSATAAGGQCAGGLLPIGPSGGCGADLPDSHAGTVESAETGFSPVIPNAEELRDRSWKDCVRQNCGECTGGSASLSEPRFKMQPPQDEAGAKLYEYLDRLNSRDRDDKRVLVLRLAGRPNACAYQGLWGKVQRLVAALGWAAAHEHAVVFQQTDNWIGVGPGWCPEKSWLCFFQGFTPYEQGEMAEEIAAWQKSHLPEVSNPGAIEPYRCLPAIPKPGRQLTTSLQQLEPHMTSKIVGWSACMHDNSRCSTTGNGLQEGIPTDHMSNMFFGGATYVPAEFRQLPDSARGGLPLEVWWEAQLSRYLLRPRRFVLDYIERSKHSVQWPEGELVIGVHVRRGDKYDNDQDVPVFEQYYLPQILDLSHTLKIRNIFVASDSPHIISGLHHGSIKGAAQAGLNWMTFGKSQEDLPEFARFSDSPGPYSKAHWYRGLKGNERVTGNQFTANTLTSIRDVWLLGQCHHFIGTRVSAVSRYAAKLLLGNRLASTTGPKADEVQILWPDFPGIDRYR